MSAVRLERGIHFCFILYVISLVTSMSGMELFSTLLAVGLIFYGRQQRIRLASIPFPPIAWPMLAFIVVALIGILRADTPGSEKWADIRRMRFFLIFAILYGYFYLLPPTLNWVRWLWAACAVIAVYGFIQHFIPLDLIRPAPRKVHMFAIPETRTGPLVVGTFNHHLTFASIFFLYASIFTCLGIYTYRRWTLLLGSILFLLCMWTQSRAAWIALPLCLFLVVLPKGKKALLTVLSGIAIFLALLYSTDAGFRARFQRTVFGNDQFYKLTDRKLLWKLNWELFKEAPLLGIGFNNNERYCPELMEKNFPQAVAPFCGHAHSTPLQILATMGLLGFLAYLWIWVSVFANLYQLFKRSPLHSDAAATALGILVGFVGFHIQGLTQWNFGDAEVLHSVVFLWAFTAYWSRKPGWIPAAEKTGSLLRRS